jgi:glycosyltransferase involved in cell wall biosynthesis
VRILYHHRTLGDGAEGIHIREMVHAFRSIGHDVQVIGPAGETPPEASRRSRVLGAIKAAIPSTAYELAEIAYSAYALCRASWEIRRFKPDFIYDRYITFNAGIVLAGRMHRLPVILEVNAPLALERREQRDEKLSFQRLAARMERWICSNATRTIVVSTPLKDYLESIGVPGGQCTVMPNGVDPDRFAPQPKDPDLLRQVGIPAQSFVVGFTGVLRPWHGLDLLLDAADKLIAKGLDLVVLIVGDGPYRGQMQQLIAKRGLQRSIRITGRVPHARVPALVSLFDVAVSPRATFYASPMKVIEYMALGKPVLVPGTPNFLDIVDDEVNGITFRDADVDALADSLARMYESPQLCQLLGQHAREKVQSRLNWRWNALRSCELACEAGPATCAAGRS